MRLRIMGLEDPETALLSTILRAHGFEVVKDEDAPCSEEAAVEAANLLTERQLEVLRAVRAHGGTEAAAMSLGLSPKTVNAHLDHIFDRIGVHERMRAVCWACRRKLLEASETGGAE